MILSRLGSRVMSLPNFRPLAGWLLVGAFVASLGVTMVVAEAAQSDPGTGVQCDPAFNVAVANSMIRHVAVVDAFMSEAQRKMQDAVSASSNKCIGDIAFGNFDISFMIPDLGGLLSALFQSALQSIIDGLTKRFCNAVNDQLQGAATSWNNIVNGLNSQLNLSGQMQTWGSTIDARIPGATDRCLANPSSCAISTGPSPISKPPAPVPAPAPTPTPTPTPAPDPVLTPDQPSKPDIPSPSGQFSLPVRQ